MLQKRPPRQGDLWRVNVAGLHKPIWWLGIVIDVDETWHNGSPCKILYMSRPKDDEHPPIFGEWIIHEDSPYFELLAELNP